LTEAQLEKDQAPTIPSNLVNLFRRKCNQTGSREMLNRAVTQSENALSSVPENSHHRPPHFSIAEMALLWRYKKTGATEDLERSVELNCAAVAACTYTAQFL